MGVSLWNAFCPYVFLDLRPEVCAELLGRANPISYRGSMPGYVPFEQLSNGCAFDPGVASYRLIHCVVVVREVNQNQEEKSMPL